LFVSSQTGFSPTPGGTPRSAPTTSLLLPLFLLRIRTKTNISQEFLLARLLLPRPFPGCFRFFPSIRVACCLAPYFLASGHFFFASFLCRILGNGHYLETLIVRPAALFNVFLCPRCVLHHPPLPVSVVYFPPPPTMSFPLCATHKVFFFLSLAWLVGDFLGVFFSSFFTPPNFLMRPPLYPREMFSFASLLSFYGKSFLHWVAVPFSALPGHLLGFSDPSKLSDPHFPRNIVLFSGLSYCLLSIYVLPLLDPSRYSPPPPRFFGFSPLFLNSIPFHCQILAPFLRAPVQPAMVPLFFGNALNLTSRAFRTLCYAVLSCVLPWLSPILMSLGNRTPVCLDRHFVHWSRPRPFPY